MRNTPESLILLWVLSVGLLLLGFLNATEPVGVALLTAGLVGVVVALALHVARRTVRDLLADFGQASAVQDAFADEADD